MKAIILAAGVGARLVQPSGDPCPKVLLRFGGRTLLQRHIESLGRLGVREIVVGAGYRHDDIRREVERLGAGDAVRIVVNPDYEHGSIVTLWALREDLLAGGTILLMDGDVLYHHDVLGRLMASPHENCVNFDRDLEPGDEPFKVWMRGGRMVDFRKGSSVVCDYRAEWTGFARLSAQIAERLVAQTRLYIDRDRRREPYEEALRDVMLSADPGTFGVEDITGLPWIEIDFAADMTRAEDEILPRVLAAEK